MSSNMHWSTFWVDSIYDLPRMSDSKLSALEAGNIHLIEDIPAEAEFVDKDKIQELLEQLEYPLHFFDFETYNPAVPMWDQSRPWQQIPFQYSLHILYEDGQVEHHEYLHTETSDPRLPLVDMMKSHFQDKGSVIVYYESFEKSRIGEMAEDFPEHAQFLNKINKRIWDQYEVFKYCFEDYRLALSKSIKTVLPTFVPDVSYQELNIQKGDQAQLVWREMINSQNKKLELEADLKKYCALDTLAMLKLHMFLQKTSSGK